MVVRHKRRVLNCEFWRSSVVCGGGRETATIKNPEHVDQPRFTDIFVYIFVCTLLRPRSITGLFSGRPAVSLRIRLIRIFRVEFPSPRPERADVPPPPIQGFGVKRIIIYPAPVTLQLYARSFIANFLHSITPSRVWRPRRALVNICLVNS